MKEKSCTFSTEDNNDNRNEKPYRPHFSWSIYGRGVLLFIIDAFLLCGACVMLQKLVLWLALGNTPLDVALFKGKNWVEIVKYSVWPSCTFVLIFLFRNPLLQILYEIPGFIRRSWYHGGDSGQPTSKKPGDENLGDVPENDQPNPGADDNGVVAIPPKTCNRHREQDVLNQIQREYRIQIHYDCGIDGSKFYFDGVMKLGDITFGIEVKQTTDSGVWRMIFDRMAEVYSGFSYRCQRHFVFMACICGEDDEKSREQVERIAAEKPFRTIVRFFPK